MSYMHCQHCLARIHKSKMVSCSTCSLEYLCKQCINVDEGICDNCIVDGTTCIGCGDKHIKTDFDFSSIYCNHCIKINKHQFVTKLTR